MPYLWIAVGSALGGVARFLTQVGVGRVLGLAFPWGTLLVNLAGCCFIGWFATSTAPGGRWLATPSLRLFVITGFCGGFTTFSSFSLEALTLARSGEWGKSAAYVLASMVLCLCGVWLGHLLAAQRLPSAN